MGPRGSFIDAATIVQLAAAAENLAGATSTDRETRAAYRQWGSEGPSLVPESSDSGTELKGEHVRWR